MCFLPSRKRDRRGCRLDHVGLKAKGGSIYGIFPTYFFTRQYLFGCTLLKSVSHEQLPQPIIFVCHNKYCTASRRAQPRRMVSSVVLFN